MDYQVLYRESKKNEEYWQRLFFQVGQILFPDSTPSPKDVIDRAKELVKLEAPTPTEDATIQQAPDAQGI